MPRKKREVAKPANVSVGNLSDISGNVNIAGRDIKTYSTQTTTGLSAGEIRQLFDQLYARIEARPETPAAAKEDLKADVKEIQTAVTEAAQKNEKVDEGFLSRRFRNIARMAPDLLDVVVATLTNPLAGLGVAAKKIAEKAKAETGGGS
jgi:cell division septum initiation protein DivIVA